MLHETSTAVLNNEWKNRLLEVTCHLTAKTLLYTFACELVPESFSHTLLELNVSQLKLVGLAMRHFTGYLLSL